MSNKAVLSPYRKTTKPLEEKKVNLNKAKVNSGREREALYLSQPFNYYT